MSKTYIIGGTPRAGKSTLSKILFKKYHINTISTDFLREGFMFGIPEFGILKDEAKQSDEDKSIILWPYLKGLLKAREFFDDDLVLEGTNFEPKFLNELENRNDLRICFLGYPNIDVDIKFKQIRSFEPFDPNDWTSEMSDYDLKDLIIYLKNKSKYFETECEKYKIKFIDTSENFQEAIELGVKYLIG